MIRQGQLSHSIQKIAIIEPRSPGTNFWTGIRIPRQGAVLLATILDRLGYQVVVHCEELAPIDWSEVISADLVAISNMTPTTPRAYAMAQVVRREGIPVVIGGYHDTFFSEEALEHVDFVVRGEGEDTLVELVEAIQTKGDFSKIAGLSFRADGQKIHNEPRPFETNLDRFPIPDFSLVRGMRRNGVVSVITRRGCPFDCSFCSVTAFNGRTVREHSVDRVLSEIDRQMYWIDKRGILFVLDDIFNLRPKRMKEILRGMIDNRLTPLWCGQVRHEAAQDRELLDLMRQSNCIRVFVGFESVNPQSLERFNKRQTVEDVGRSIEAFRRASIKVLGMFVMGSDDDTPETLEETLRFCRRHNLDSMFINNLTPLPGSRDFSEMSARPNKLLGVPWHFYDNYHVVQVPSKISPAQLQTGSNSVMAKFYSLRAVIQRLVRGDLSDTVVRFICYLLVRKLIWETRPYVRWLRNTSGKPPSPPITAEPEKWAAQAKGTGRISSWFRHLCVRLTARCRINYVMFLHFGASFGKRRKGAAKYQ